MNRQSGRASCLWSFCELMVDDLALVIGHCKGVIDHSLVEMGGLFLLEEKKSLIGR